MATRKIQESNKDMLNKLKQNKTQSSKRNLLQQQQYTVYDPIKDEPINYRLREQNKIIEEKIELINKKLNEKDEEFKLKSQKSEDLYKTLHKNKFNYFEEKEKLLKKFN